MSSFIANGHALHLHVYEEPRGVPTGVQLVDAAKILPEDQLFRHTRTGSLAPFADWFRYRLLLQLGGIWADTDMVCLRPFDYGQSDIYGWMDSTTINNALLGLAAGHPLAEWMAQCCERPNRILPYDTPRTWRRKIQRRLLQGNLRGRVRWGEYGPEGLTLAARHLGYVDRALPFWHFYPIHHKNWRAIFDSSLVDNPDFLGQSRGLHLWNEMLRRVPGFNKNARFPTDSVFEKLCRRYLTNDS